MARGICWVAGLVLLAACSSAESSTTGGLDLRDAPARTPKAAKPDQGGSSSGDGSNTPDPAGTVQGVDGGGPDATPPAVCSLGDGSTFCGTTDGADKDNLYTCNGGTYSRTKSCSAGCDPKGGNGGAACKPNPFLTCCPIVKARPAPDNNNFCHAPPGTAGCPMTAPGGYCDPNGDMSYVDGDWVRGYNEFLANCK